MIDIYSPKFMLGVIEQTPPLRTFLKDTFFNQSVVFPTETIEFDVKKGGISMAPFVSSRIGSTNLERQGYTTKSYKPPLVAPKRTLTTDDLDFRLAGEPQYNGYSPDERATQLLASDLEELDRAITLREELMCAQVLFNGSIPVVGEGVDEIIKFDFTNEIVVDSSKLWFDYKNSKPIDDLYKASEIIAETGMTADICISDVATIRHLIRNEELKDMLDRKNYNVGIIEPQVLKNGVMYFGYLTEPGLHIYGYNAKYADNTNVNPKFPSVKPADKEFKPAVYSLIPTGKVLVASTSMRNKMLYGVIKDLQIGSFMKPRVPKQWEQQEPSERYIKISSRPLPCPLDLDSWVVLDVLN